MNTMSAGRIPNSTSRLLQKLNHVAVGVQKGCHPTTPMLLLRRSDELDALVDQCLVNRVDVFNVEIDHESIRVGGLAVDFGVRTDAESHVAPLEIDEIRADGMRRQAHRFCIEFVEAVQVFGPDYYAVDLAYHSVEISDFVTGFPWSRFSIAGC